jgi:amino acid adenylation domain-containing protein
MSTAEPLDPLSSLSPVKRALLLKTLQRQSSASAQAAITIPRRGPQEAVPLSFAQQRLWFLDQLAPGDPSYNVSFPARFTGPLDPGLLRRSLGEIVRRHEALRTAFVMAAGEPRQSIEPFSDFSLPLVDLRGLPPAVREPEVLRLAREEDGRPFSLRRPPLLRATLLRLADDENVALLAMHHIVSDAWSLGVLSRELITIYRALAAGEPAALPELPIQYADFAVWQRQWLRGERLVRLVDFWRQRLAGAPEVTELPADRPRPAQRGSAGAERLTALPTELIAALREIGQGRKATLFMVGLAAFQALIHRYTGNRDLVLGTPLAGRDLVELEPLIGYFVNTLPLRTGLAGNPTVDELLDRVSEATTGAFDHQSLPFEALVDEIHPERSLSHTPIFQLVFVLNAGGEEPPAQAGTLALQPLRVGKTTAKFDLVLELTEGTSPVATAQFSSELFDDATVDRLLRHYASLLTAFAATPSQRLSELPLLSAAERSELLHDLASALARYPGHAADQPLHRLFEEQVRRAPAAPAVSCGEVTWSYGELNQRANRLARYLRSRGVGPEVPVALCLERSPDQVLAILAVLKAGGAYVAIEPSMPAERIDFVLADAKIEHGLTHSSIAGRLPAERTRWICLDRVEEAEVIARESSDDLLDSALPQTLAYLLYTSGSTGKPKGVLITHHNVARLLAACAGLFDFGPDDVWTFFHSYAFDFSVWEMWGALAYGGRLVVVPYLVSRSPAAFYELLRGERVTVLNQTPSAFRELVAAEGTLAAPWIDSLRFIVFGGEALDYQALEPWFARHGDARPRLVNMYGITETTVHVTWRPVSRREAANGVGSYIGFSLPDLALYLLDPDGNLAAFGAPAEIHVAGAGLARGYLGRPDLTAERFVPDPFSGTSGGRLYRTGDLARWRAGGELEYLGRRDQQVKVRGFRIEVGEIEAVLSGHPALSEVAVAARRTAAGEPRLVAYVVSGSAELTVEELQSFAREQLPEYMVPAVFVVMPSLPRTVNGKLDRAALPEPDGGRLAPGQRYIEPRTPIERELAAIWSDVLGVERVGVLDSFFALGGDSILSVRVLAKAEEKGLRFSLQQLFQYQTVAELAREIERGETAAVELRPYHPFELVAEADRLRLPPGLEDAYPPARLQLGMLYHSELSADSPLYHNIMSCQVRAPFDREAFRAAAEQLIARHPVLRTGFDLVSWSEPLQLVHRTVSVPIEVIDLQQLPDAAQEEELAAWMEVEKTRGFDWSQPPLLRFQIFLRSKESFQFSFTEHHAILDGWSVSLLLTELFERFLAGLGRREQPAGRPPATGMGELVRLEREALSSEEHQAFWDRHLEEVEVVQVPRWQEGGTGSGGDRIRNLAVPVTAETSTDLKRLAAEAGVPLKSVLLAAHLRALAQIAGRWDILTGLVTHGRLETEDGERVLGLFLNTVPFRQRLVQGTWSDLSQATFAVEREILPYRRFPLADIQARHNNQSLFETAFNFVHFHAYEQLGELPEVEILAGEAFQQTHFTLMANFRLTLGSRDVLLDLQYDGRELSQGQMTAIGGVYARILERMAAAPLNRHDAGSLLSEGELHALVLEGNDTVEEFTGALGLHQLFEAQATATPDALAVVAEARTLSYRELDLAADRLAHQLRELGVGPETLVGVAMERAAEMVVALLAVLKAGAGYVPLDPDLPAERLSYMLEDSGVEVVLCQPHTVDNLPAGQARKLVLDSGLDIPETRVPPRLQSVVSGDQVAYMIYTSGSTGRPKGVPNTHRGIRNRLLWMQSQYHLTCDDCVLQKTPASFDVSVWEFFWPLIAGARLVLARPGGHQDPAYLRDLIAAQGVTTLHFVPSMLRAFLAEPGVERAGSSLRRVFASGEALPPDLVEQLFHVVSGMPAALYNLYGPTEAAVDVSAWTCRRGETLPRVPIGRPVANTRILLLDPQLAPVPVGSPGAIYLGGTQLARGYHRRPDLTALHFLPDPWSEVPGERLYRTGDLGRFLPDSSVDFLGRIDFQVKIRGYRIELGEIESALRQHGSVEEAVVTVRDEGDGNRRLVAYVVGGEREPAVAELTEFLRTRLPAYMVPAAFVVLAQLPLTVSGKVDRRALPAPSGERPDLQSAYVAPQTPAEEILARIWVEVLRVERVGIDDSLFALGGDSMLSLQILSRARHEGFEFKLQDLYQHQTVRELALFCAPPTPVALTAPDDDEALLRMLEELSDDEVMQRLESLQSEAKLEDA